MHGSGHYTPRPTVDFCPFLKIFQEIHTWKFLTFHNFFFADAYMKKKKNIFYTLSEHF